MDDKIKRISIGRRERILDIQKKRMSGLQTGEIALQYGISKQQVQKDLRDSKLLDREVVSTFDQGAFIGQAIMFWRQMRDQAMRDYQKAQNENAKVGFERVAMEAEARLERLLLDTGMIVASGTGAPGTDPQQIMERMLKFSGVIDLSVLAENKE